MILIDYNAVAIGSVILQKDEMNEDLFRHLILNNVRMYRNKFKDHEVYFNANIFSRNSGKIWWGDIDLTEHCDKLQEIANILNDDLFVLRELDGRFENENLPFEEVKQRAVKFYLAS